MIRPGSDDPILAALRGRSVLVTGARGFIGGALCSALLEAGAEVHGTTRGEIPQDDDGEAAPLWWRCDPAAPGEIESLLRLTQPEIIFHMSAAVTGSRSIEAVLPTLRDNLVSTINILLAAEEQFGIRMSSAEIETLTSVGALADLIAAKMQAKAKSAHG